MSTTLISPATGICICIAGIIVGIVAWRRHKAAALITITGWSLGLIINGITIFLLSRENYIQPSAWFNLGRALFFLAGYICIFLGIYLPLKKATSQAAFFSLKYEGLDLRPNTERDS